MSRFKKALQSGKFLVLVKMTPPRGVNLEPFLSRLEKLPEKVDAVNLPDNRSAKIHLSGFAAALLAREKGVEPVLTFCCRDRNRLALSSDLLGASALGLSNILCVTGDYMTFGDAPEAKPVYDLDSVQAIRMIREMEKGKDIGNNDLDGPPAFCVGCVANPQAIPLEPHLLKLGKKLEAGVDFIQTLDLFDLDRSMPLFEYLKGKGVRVLAGARLITEKELLLFEEGKLSGNPIPEEITGEIKDLGESEKVIERAVTRMVEMIKGLKDSGLCHGIHLTTDGHEDLIPRILQEAGI